MQNRILVLLITILSILSFRNASAWDNVITHLEITKNAIKNSKLYDDLKNKINIEDGANLTEWLKAGSRQEDEPMCRASNHFHNPIKKIWTSAGLSDPFWIVNKYCETQGQYPPKDIKSAVSWATGYIGPSPENLHIETNNEFNWDNARKYYYYFLTGRNFQGSEIAGDESTRNNYLSACFQSIGQVLHLLQDMSVPAHVRNDFKSHIYCVEIDTDSYRMASKFETYVRNNALIGGYTNPNIKKPTALTNFWDSGNYSGENFGLAEYTNMNFASSNTIFTENNPQNGAYYQPYPRMDRSNANEYLYHFLSPKTLKNGDKVFFISTTGPYGEVVENFAKSTYFTDEIKKIYDDRYRDAFIASLTVDDDLCFEEYAAKLIPYAIGYSAELIDYFFRGYIDLTFDQASYAYKIVNKTEENMDGTFKIYYDNTDEKRIMLFDGRFVLAANSSYTIDNFIQPEDAKECGKYILVFRGNLGKEENAVAGRMIKGVGNCPFKIRIVRDIDNAVMSASKDDDTCITIFDYQENSITESWAYYPNSRTAKYWKQDEKIWSYDDGYYKFSYNFETGYWNIYLPAGTKIDPKGYWIYIYAKNCLYITYPYRYKDAEQYQPADLVPIGKYNCSIPYWEVTYVRTLQNLSKWSYSGYYPLQFSVGAGDYLETIVKSSIPYNHGWVTNKSNSFYGMYKGGIPQVAGLLSGQAHWSALYHLFDLWPASIVLYPITENRVTSILENQSIQSNGTQIILYDQTHHNELVKMQVNIDYTFIESTTQIDSFTTQYKLDIKNTSDATINYSVETFKQEITGTIESGYAATQEEAAKYDPSQFKLYSIVSNGFTNVTANQQYLAIQAKSDFALDKITY